jgi:hypothetical protein
LGGERAKQILNPRAEFALARQLRSPEGAPLGDVFSFVSGLYFRGKAQYATAFGSLPQGITGGLVITQGEGLRFLHERVTVERLLAWMRVPIDLDNEAFTEPLIGHCRELLRVVGENGRFVLLGSVATDKYVRPLTRVLGDRLLFPADFVGRGDMSRGAMMLDAVRAKRELDYTPVSSSLRHGPRAESLRSRRQR